MRHVPAFVSRHLKETLDLEREKNVEYESMRRRTAHGETGESAYPRVEIQLRII